MVTRNQLCPCGSGRRFKHCHGRPAAPPPDAQARIDAEFRRIAAERLQHGRPSRAGRPIVSWTDDAGRYVAVDQRVFCGPWKTFVDFLGHYIARTLGTPWGNAELGKPAAVRHPLMTWYHAYRERVAAGERRIGELHPPAPTGVAAAYLGVAYDLYTLEHDGERLAPAGTRERLLARLKDTPQFAAARHTIRVAAALLRNGFSLRFDDAAQDGFVATDPSTQRALRIACRVRPQDDAARWIDAVEAALREPADLPRLVCVDVAAPAPDWRTTAVAQLRAFEADPAHAALPPAYVIVANSGRADVSPAGDDALLDGLRIGAVRSTSRALHDVLAVRHAHPQAFEVLAALRAQAGIPSRFDAQTPFDAALPQRPRLGTPYTLADGRSGVVVSAFVKDPEPVAVLLLAFEDGRRRFHDVPLSEQEVAAWRRYPETFFGALALPPAGCRDPLDVYAFFEAAYRDQPRERLLEWMARWPQPERRQPLSQPRLLEQFCSVLTERALADT